MKQIFLVFSMLSIIAAFPGTLACSRKGGHLSSAEVSGVIEADKLRLQIEQVKAGLAAGELKPGMPVDVTIAF
ncbi:MAG: hypothetical protein FJY82_15315 [Candidatus Aminicenantes bacterium]|nr:hypothetical protein [Candidatus Aminicenantes bacterium]